MSESIIVFRLWLPIQPADRPPHPRVLRLQQKSCRTLPAPKIHQGKEPQRIILSGGPANVYAPTPQSATWRFFELGIPFWGFAAAAADDPHPRRQNHRSKAREYGKRRCSALPSQAILFLPVWSALKPSHRMSRRQSDTLPRSQM